MAPLPDPAARVDDRADADLRPVLDHDRREAVLVALEHRVADVVGDDRRALGQEHLAADQHRPARVHEDLVADERQISDRERRPGVTMAAAADSDAASGMHVRADERPAAADLEPGPDVGQLTDGEDLGALDGRPGSEPRSPLDQEPGSDQERPLLEDGVVRDERPVGAVELRLLAGRQGAYGLRLGAQALDERRVEEPGPLVGAEARGQADVLGRRTGEHGIPDRRRRLPDAAAREPRRPRR